MIPDPSSGQDPLEIGKLRYRLARRSGFTEGYAVDVAICAALAARPVVEPLTPEEAGDVIAACSRWLGRLPDRIPSYDRVESAILKLRVLADQGECEHDWVSVRNVESGGPVESGEWCAKCGAIRASEELRDQGKEPDG